MPPMSSAAPMPPIRAAGVEAGDASDEQRGSDAADQGCRWHERRPSFDVSIDGGDGDTEQDAADARTGVTHQSPAQPSSTRR